jgi:NADH dehydrogenase
MAKRERVLIVGGGFAGVKTALELAGDEHVSVTLLTDHDEFRYYPTLYHTATGGKRAGSAVPYKDIFEGTGMTLMIGSAKTLDRKAKTITTADGSVLEYDILVLALGVVTNYFNIPGLADMSYSIKSSEEALRFKKHLHDQLTSDKKPDLNYLIVGAGPTGIELAGMLPRYVRKIMKNHGLKERNINVRLIEAAPRLLPRMPKATSRYVKWRLKRLGVKIHLGKLVQGQTADSLMIDGKPMRTHTVVWTAGVTNHPFFAENHFVLMPRGKVATDIYLQSEENIFVLGDNANTPYSGLAQTAVRDGALTGKNILRKVRGRDMKAYKPRTPISVIPVGKYWAVVNYRKLQIHGLLGWWLRSAADFVAFKDLESWPKAARQWTEDQQEEETCPHCVTPVADTA